MEPDFKKLPQEAYSGFMGWLLVFPPGKYYALAYNIGSLIDHSKKTQWLVHFSQAVLLGNEHLTYEDRQDLGELIETIVKKSPSLIPAPEGYTQKVYRAQQIPEFLLAQLRRNPSKPYLKHSDN